MHTRWGCDTNQLYNRDHPQEGSLQGRQAASLLADALITMQYVGWISLTLLDPPRRALPTMPLGVLHDLPGLQPAAHDALHNRQQRALAALSEAVTHLQQAAATIHEAAATLATNQDDAVLWSTQPVFVSYTMMQLGAL